MFWIESFSFSIPPALNCENTHISDPYLNVRGLEYIAVNWLLYYPFYPNWGPLDYSVRAWAILRRVLSKEF